MSYYRVSTYDPTGFDFGDRWAWRCIVWRCRKWTLRRVLRRLYDRGYDRDLSILVERVEATA